MQDPPYQSIKADVLQKLNKHLPEIRGEFGVVSIGIFGSVSREEDTPESDVDVIVSFAPGEATLAHLIYLGDYLENLFDRKVDLVTESALSKYIRQEVISEVIRV